MSHAEAQPLVSCIMPTCERRRFVPQAIRYFLRQDYDSKELIIVDDGREPIKDLVPEDERIRYVRLPGGHTLGAKRNLACDYARGQIIAHWDDDDWYAPHRLSYQVAALLSEEADVCGLNNLLYYDIETRQGWLYLYPSDRKLWLAGNTLCYWRAFWETNHFANIDVGEDACFMWTQRPKRVALLEDRTFFVGIIHTHNISPKETASECWQSSPVEEIRQVVGEDWSFYSPANEPAVAIAENGQHKKQVADCVSSSPLRNVYACLVHERQECVMDLVRNLRYHDPLSEIILYNGSRNPYLLNHGAPFEKYGAVIHPSPKPMSWGVLHGFALDCMKFALDNFSFDTLTIVDSDQLGVRSGYVERLHQDLSNHTGIGLLGNSPEPQPSHTRIAPAIQAWKEFELWRPFLSHFEQGEEKFVHWTFWPSTVFTFDAARDLLRLFNGNENLQNIMRRSLIWATEEVVLPTLVALLGYKLAANPCSYDYVRYRINYTIPQVEEALARPDIFWIHPVPRQYDNLMRQHIRDKFNHYERAGGMLSEASDVKSDASTDLLQVLPLLARMRNIDGWLDDVEADLLIAIAARALTSLPKPQAIVEIGSYCGRSTVVLGGVVKALSPETRIHAIDPHDGKVGALDQGVINCAPTLDMFRRNIAGAGLEDVVTTIQKYSYEVAWDEPISLLFIDGLHDYTNVARDFSHFEQWVLPGGYIAFHDYADYYPGVQAFVNEILRTGKYRKVRCEKSMMVVEKL